ncbi:hypothetical protein [Enterococcus faecium]|nr:hypothetical protein [Enterococcus faecium]
MEKLSEITNSYVDMESQGLIAATIRNNKMSKENEYGVHVNRK